MNENVIYTVITDDKYFLNDIKVFTPGWDYICITTVPGLHRKNWKIVYKQGEYKNRRRLSRNYKILADSYFKDYEKSIYIDTRFTVKQDLNEFVKNNLPDNCDIAVMKHNRRSCVYKEAKVLLEYDLFDNENIENLVHDFKIDGMPENNGLYAPGIMIRRHNVMQLSKMCFTWYKKMMEYSYRDMLSLAYAIWKHPEVNIHLMDFKTTYEGFMDR
jgi:hypothetical protein